MMMMMMKMLLLLQNDDDDDRFTVFVYYYPYYTPTNKQPTNQLFSFYRYIREKKTRHATSVKEGARKQAETLKTNRKRAGN